MKPLISIVSPAYNEAKNLDALVQRIRDVFLGLEYRWELILVDDGSVDGTSEAVAALHRADERVKLITLSRNFGHQIALTAGMDSANGDAVVVIDADLQQPPELIREMLERWREGYEVVYSVRDATADATLFKRITATLFYRIFRKLTGMDVPANAADFRLLDAKVVRAFSAIRERSRFMRGLTTWVGYRSIGLRYQADARINGQSSYTIKRMFRLAVDGIVSFSPVPLYLATYLGFVISGLGFLYFLYILYISQVSKTAVLGWASILSAITTIGGIQLILLGIMGTYVARIYEEVKQRPLYLVRKKLGFPSEGIER